MMETGGKSNTYEGGGTEDGSGCADGGRIEEKEKDGGHGCEMFCLCSRNQGQKA